jgi:hypothetical protein
MFGGATDGDSGRYMEGRCQFLGSSLCGFTDVWKINWSMSTLVTLLILAAHE